MITVADMKEYAPEFKDVNTAKLQRCLDMATRFVSETAWGVKYDDGVLHLALHYLTLAQRRDVSGSVQSEQVGDLSVTYGSDESDSSDYGSTSYGRIFYAMMKTLVLTPRVAECP